MEALCARANRSSVKPIIRSYSLVDVIVQNNLPVDDYTATVAVLFYIAHIMRNEQDARILPPGFEGFLTAALKPCIAYRQRLIDEIDVKLNSH